MMGDAYQRNKKFSSHLDMEFESSEIAYSWLEVKVVYVKVSRCPLDGNPDLLTMHIPKHSIDTSLEVNGARIPPSEEVYLHLRRDRLDMESVEVTYISTDHLRASATIAYELFDKDELLVSGHLEKTNDEQSDVHVFGFDSGNNLSRSLKLVWNMDCNCAVGSSGCVFMRGKHESSLSPPSMEICVVGRYLSSPVILTQVVQLSSRRRIPRYSMLDAIPEHEECGIHNSLVLDSAACQEADETNFEKNDGKLHLAKYFGADGVGYMDGEDGDMSWFNAGVRVGVGIGLGVCLGVGIGVGLMFRTYQATTRPFRRRGF